MFWRMHITTSCPYTGTLMYLASYFPLPATRFMIFPLYYIYIYGSDYVLHKAFEGQPDKVYRTKTYIAGNLDAVKVDEEMKSLIQDAEKEELERDGEIEMPVTTAGKSFFGSVSTVMYAYMCNNNMNKGLIVTIICVISP
jgi:hypothetical protein